MATIHTPKNFDPKDYEIIDYIDNHGPECPYVPAEFSDLTRSAIYAEYTKARKEWEDNCRSLLGEDWGQKIHSCVHCGHSFHTRYIAIAKQFSSGENVSFGHICARRIGIVNKAEFRLKYIKDYASNMETHNRRTTAKYEFLFNHPGLEQKLLTDHHIISDINHRLYQYGNLSDAQINLVDKIIEQIAETARKKNEEDALPKTNCPEGKIEISGIIMGFKQQENEFGTSLKMIVRDNRGFKVYGTVPRDYDSQKGDTITFTATICPSNTDQYFGFFKRPKMKKA
jgi:hypothetical protein